MDRSPTREIHGPGIVGLGAEQDRHLVVDIGLGDDHRRFGRAVGHPLPEPRGHQDPRLHEVLEVLHVVDVAVDVDIGEPHVHGVVAELVVPGRRERRTPLRILGFEERLQRRLLVRAESARPLAREHVRREDRGRLQVDAASLVGLVEDLVGERERRGPDLGHPALDVDRPEPERQWRPVMHLVAYDDHPLGQLAGLGRGTVGAQHVDPRLLEVVDVDDVVDMSLQVHVGPAHRALVAVAHGSMLPERTPGDRSGRRV